MKSQEASTPWQKAFSIGIIAFVIVCFCYMFAVEAQGLTINFDYRFDTQGMFAAAERREAFEAAADIYTDFGDQLSELSPGGGNSWSLSVTRPDGAGSAVVDNLQVAADSITVFVGGWSFHPSVLGWAGNGQITSVNGTQQWQDTVFARGQTGALADRPTDFGPWGGAITFNSSVNWHFDTLTTPQAGQQDFFTTAMHELGHILGFGEAASWFAQVQGSVQDGWTFAGTQSVAQFGDVVPLDGSASHWAEGISDFYLGIAQETAMDPSTPSGVRQYMTDLDYAGLADIGWEVPEPSSLMLFSLSAWLAVRRRPVPGKRFGKR